MYVCMLFSSLPIGPFQWPITSSITLTFNLNWLVFLQQLRFTSLSVFIQTHPVNFPVGGNQSAQTETPTFGRVLTNSFRIGGALGSSNIENVLTENEPATSEVKGECSDHCATIIGILMFLLYFSISLKVICTK